MTASVTGARVVAGGLSFVAFGSCRAHVDDQAQILTFGRNHRTYRI